MTCFLALCDRLGERTGLDDVAVTVGCFVIGTKKAGNLADFICFKFD